MKCDRKDCVYTSCLALLCVFMAGSWSDFRDALGSVRFLFECYQAGRISQFLALFSTAAISSEGDIAAVLFYEAKLWMKKKINNLIQW